jgi:PAS domain S-box-containing protein
MTFLRVLRRRSSHARSLLYAALLGAVADVQPLASQSLPQRLLQEADPTSLTIAIVFIMLVLQAALICWLLVQRARRRQMEAQLRDSEARFRTMADTATVMLWIADVDGLLTFCNRAWLEFAGTSLDEQLGLRWTSILHPDDRHRCMGIYRQSFQRRHEFTFECRFRSRGGMYRWLLCSGVPCYADNGAFEGYLGSCVDITMRYEAELEHRHHIAEVAHLNRLATTGALTASIAHELSQPLSAIMFNASAAALILEKSPAAAERIRPILADIRQDDQRAVDIIRKLRNLLQRHELTRQPLAVNPLLEDTVQLMSVEAATRHIALACEPSPANPFIAGDRVHLQQVIINLVLNALQAVTSTPIDQRRVGVRADITVDGAVRISVRDSGPGVAADAVGQIFEPFHTTRANGLGLGLSICRTIVEAHDGRIWVESDAGGARFYVSIPLLARKAGPAIVSGAVPASATDASVVRV